jgi:histidyl-tRNA synthetase
MSSKIPNNISGFPEWSPDQLQFEKKCKDIIESNFATLGYLPLTTSSVELITTLTGIGTDDKEIYTLSRLNSDNNEEEKKYALHFDLTVPLARYVTQRERDLNFPFKRYQIQNSWRGETPASGRYREFTQCDADIIGRANLPISYDAELVYLVYKIFAELNLGKFKIKISNSKILFGLLSKYDLNTELIRKIIRLIDKRDKMKADKFISELHLSLIDYAGCYEIVSRLIDNRLRCNQILDLIDEDLGDDYNTGVRELNQVIEMALAFGVNPDNLEIDLSLARGLNYYTGTIIETRLIEHATLGSVCGGGRYDNLTERFGGGRFPGVGISIGLTRILGFLFENNLINLHSKALSGVLIANMGEDYQVEALKVSKEIRDNKEKMNTRTVVENYFLSKKLGDQINYAITKSYKYIIILGDQEILTNSITIKNLETRGQLTISRGELMDNIY